MLSEKIMVIGLDGLTLKVLHPLIQRGSLPTFARLLQYGGAGLLRSVTNMTTGPTWATFATGCLPARHGILHDFHHLPDSYTLQPTNGGLLRVPTFWEYASQQGAQVITLNIPMSYPARPVNGILLAGIDAPAETAPGFDYPPGTYRTLRRHTGDYLIDCGLASFMQAGQVERGVAAVTRETEARTRAAEYFLQNHPWNLFTVVYSLPDVWQHYYWTSSAGSPGRQLLEQGYEMMDAQLARLLEWLPEGGWMVIASDHGFGPLL
ncbi:MAG TPA: alkaline phosphatase family protein, partial [Anaerolineales bacterium]|nr:alkaline phosphatase family protein [Anaerolineales bacterium]